MTASKLHRLTIVVGPLAALVVSAATSSIRDQAGATNVGVALAIIVVLAALTGRGAGLLTAAAAATSFNFFHTQPYHSLRVHESRDVIWSDDAVAPPDVERAQREERERDGNEDDVSHD